MVKDLVVIGVGFPDIVQIIDEINSNQKKYNFIGFLDDNPKLKDFSLYKYPVIGNINWLDKHKNVVAINTVAKNTQIRKFVNQKILDKNISLINLVHPSVNLKYTVIGNGNIISKNVYLEATSKIGSHCMVLSNSTIGHDCVIENNCFIGPGVHILGGVTVKDNCLIGSGSVIHPKVKLEEDTTIGINSKIFKNTEKGGTYLSVPSKLFQKRKYEKSET